MPDSAQLVTREYQELYLNAAERKPSQRIGMTKREVALNWVFTGLYGTFAIGILCSWLF